MSDALLTAESEYRPAFFHTESLARMTFDNLMPFRKNQALLRSVRAIATADKTPSRWLFLHGKEGVGKTHLLSACADLAAHRSPLLVNLLDLDAEVRRADCLGCRAPLRELLSSAEPLLLDDVHLAHESRDLQHELLAVSDRRLASGRATVVASLHPPEELQGMPAQLRSRLAAGPVVRLEVGDAEERFQLLRTLVPEDELAADVLRYLAEQIEDSVRRLTEASQQLRLAQVGLDEPITREIARAMVPPPEDVAPALQRESRPPARQSDHRSGARYREMLATAETRQEEILALQIAVGERLRCRREDDDDEMVKNLEAALQALRDGDIDNAVLHLSATERPPQADRSGAEQPAHEQGKESGP